MLSSKSRISSVVFICALMVVLMDIQFVQAGAVISYPGTRAKAMGSTFTAIANDMSAVWYNPAGMAMGKEAFDGTAEWGQAVAIDEEEHEYKGNENKFFIGGAWSGEKWGSGFYYQSPYTLNQSFYSEDPAGSHWDHFEEDMEFLGFVLARSFWDNRLKLGATLDYTMITIKEDNSDISYEDSTSSANLTNDAEFVGISSNLGAKFTAVDYRPWALQVDVGGVYRFPSAVSLSTAEHKLTDEWGDARDGLVDKLEDFVLEKPSSYALGAAVNKGLVSLKSNLIVSVQYEVTDWSKSNDAYNSKYEKDSLGLEWQFLEVPMFERLSLRTGYYKTESSESSFESEGFSQGIGVRIGESIGAEFSAEQRTWNSDTDYEENFDLYSLSLTYTY